MAVIATPVNKSNAQVDSLRLFMRDYFDKNPLHDDVEFTDEELDVALNQAVLHANVIGRPTNYTLGNFPNKYVLNIGAVAHLQKSEAIRQLRNQASFQDGNIQGVGIDDKSSSYLQIAQMMQQEFTQHVQNIKVTSNLPVSGFRSPMGRSVYTR
tara:strand:+ start:3301 stop:3762 length:462 start_codon:yes stop_codon:yes gene_type:complete